jgi:FecR protein
MRCLPLGILSLLLLSSSNPNLPPIAPAIAQSNPPIQLRLKRWIQIQSVSGNVTYRSNGNSQSAQPGQRLASVGDGIITGKNSSATLVLDEGIGTIQVSEKTQLTIDRLQSNNGGLITRLQINGGQVRLKVRRLNNPNSSLQIISPAGVTGVRGTDFGVSVLPSGKTGVATLSGKVNLEAQSVTVPIPLDFQSLVLPKEAPLPASPLINDPTVKLERLEVRDFGNNVRLSGSTDNVNLLTIGETVIETDRTGNFDIVMPLTADRQLILLSTTPLGRKQSYLLRVP